MTKKEKTSPRIDREMEINLRVWKDPEFKKQLLKNPFETLKKLGYPSELLPKNIKIIEESENTPILILRKFPKRNPSLSERELQALAAGNASGRVCTMKGNPMTCIRQ